MKRKLISILLAASILSGCNNSTDPSATSTASDTAQETSATKETTTAPVTTPATTTTEDLNAETPLTNILKKDIPISSIDVNDGGERVIFYNQEIYDGNFEIISGNSIRITEMECVDVRYSTGVLDYAENDAAKYIIRSDENNYSHNFISYDKFKSAYWINYKYPMVTFSKVTRNEMTTKSAVLSYEINSKIQVNAFIKKNGDGCDIIIDPAYMYNLPLFTNRPERYKFDINGKEIIADTLALKGVFGNKDLKLDNENYVYAKIEMQNLECSYDTFDGYDNKASVMSVEILSEDIDAIINEPFQITNPDKDPEPTEVYNAILKNLDKLNTEDTYGIELLDMDFDGKPEVLVSTLNKDDENFYNWSVDVDIYRVKDGDLKYIDTINNAHMVVYSSGNRLGLKVLDNGTRAWFSTAKINRDGKDTGDYQTDYLYTLEGDKLKYTEVFSAVVTGRTENEGGWTDIEYDYYFMGEKIVPEIALGYDPHYDPDYDYGDDIEKPEPDYEYYSWNGLTANYGMWELVGFIRARYCDDIELVHNLYSDWLCDSGKSIDMPRYELSDRVISYRIAYMVDGFYYGEYDTTFDDYYYEFLGDYAKPVIYLYPEEKTDISVSVEFKEGGELTCTYPEYTDGWNVTAMPDGTLYDENGNEYYCLYWEGEGNAKLDISKGYCIKGEDTADFLREKLMYIGLTAREANEFIIYWLPLMEDNKYNLITLHTDDYSASVPLNVSPAPDTIIRVFMTFEPVSEFTEIEEQVLPSYERNGFTLVEWGGSQRD